MAYETLDITYYVDNIKIIYIYVSAQVLEADGYVYVKFSGGNATGSITEYKVGSSYPGTTKVSATVSNSDNSSTNSFSYYTAGVNHATHYNLNNTFYFYKSTSSRTVTVSLTSKFGSYSGNVKTFNVTVPALPKYTISYNANGGSGAPSSQTKYYNQDIYLSSSVPSRTNYVFAYWGTTSSGGTRWDPGERCSLNSNLTLYAIWYSPYTVSFNANGGSGAPSSQTKVYNQTLTLSNSTPTRTNYVFRAWNTNSSGTGTWYNPGQAYSTNANLTLYAIWYPPYTISYNANGGTGIPNNQTKIHNTNITIPNTIPTRTNYVFRAWNTNSSGTGTWYDPGQAYTANASVTLYAIWYPPYTISYNLQGGSPEISSQLKIHNQTLVLSTSIPSKTGYIFKWWNTVSNGTGTVYTPGSNYTSNATVTLYAIWAIGIFYDANGGSGAPAGTSANAGETVQLSTIIPVKNGYSFISWNLKIDGTGTRYNRGSSIRIETSTIYLYAQWKKEPDPPTIVTMITTRCNSNGFPDDEGGYFKLTTTWYVDTTLVENNHGSLEGRYKKNTDVGYKTFYPVNTETSPGSYSTTTIVGDGTIDSDSQYDIVIRARDKDGRKTTRYDTLTRAQFVWDIKRGGLAMGIGSAAPDNGFEVGWDTQLDKTLCVLGDSTFESGVLVKGTVHASNITSVIRTYDSDVVSGTNAWTVNGASISIFCEYICSLTVRITSPSAYSAQGFYGAIAVLDSKYRPINTQTFGCRYGTGLISTSGTIWFVNYSSINTGTIIEIGLTYLR